MTLLPRLERETASSLLDWLLPAIAAASPGTVRWPHADTAASPVNEKTWFTVDTYDRATTDRWQIATPLQQPQAAMLKAVADLRPLPAEEPLVPAARIEPILAALDTPYPALEMTTLPARVAVSDLKRRLDAQQDLDERAPRTTRRLETPPQPLFVTGDAGSPNAVTRGLATHRFLQLVDLDRRCDLADLERQREAMADAGLLSPADAAAVMIESCQWFFASELGERLRQRGADVHREVPFVSCVDPSRYDPDVAGRDDRDVILVRGMVDAMIVAPEALEVIDYKTDVVSAEACDERAARYHTQVETYARALGAIYARPVRAAWLVFLHPRRIMPVPFD